MASGSESGHAVDRGGTHSFPASTDTSGVLTNLPLRADFDYGWQGSSTAISTPMENAPGIETLCAAQAEATRMSIFETAAEVADFLDERGVPYAIIGGLAVQHWGEPRATHLWMMRSSALTRRIRRIPGNETLTARRMTSSS